MLFMTFLFNISKKVWVMQWIPSAVGPYSIPTLSVSNTTAGLFFFLKVHFLLEQREMMACVRLACGVKQGLLGN